MLRDNVVVHKNVALLPSVKHSDLVRHLRQVLQIFVWNGSSVAVHLLRNLLSRTVAPLRILPVSSQAREQSREVRHRLSANGGQYVRQHHAVLNPFPGRVLDSAVSADLDFNLGSLGGLIIPVPGGLIIPVPEVFAKSLQPA